MRIFELYLADDTDLCYNNARQNLSANVNGEVSTEEAYNEKLAEYNSKNWIIAGAEYSLDDLSLLE